MPLRGTHTPTHRPRGPEVGLAQGGFVENLGMLVPPSTLPLKHNTCTFTQVQNYEVGDQYDPDTHMEEPQNLGSKRARDDMMAQMIQQQVAANPYFQSQWWEVEGYKN